MHWISLWIGIGFAFAFRPGQSRCARRFDPRGQLDNLVAIRRNGEENQMHLAWDLAVESFKWAEIGMGDLAATHSGI